MMRYLSSVFVGADKLFIGFQYCYVLWICDENIANKILKILDDLEFRKKQNRINISPHSSSCCSVFIASFVAIE